MNDNKSIYEKYDEEVGKLLTITLAFPLLTNFFGVLVSKIGIPTTYTTYLIYSLFLLYLATTLVKYSRINELSKLLIVYFLSFFIILINYTIFLESRVYFKANMEALLFVLFIYSPVAHLMTLVKDWQPFLQYMRTIAYLTPIIGVLSYYFLNISSVITYMMFSNMILPGLMLSWYYYRKERRLVWLITFLIDFSLILIYGGRMSLFSSIVFIILLELFIHEENRNSVKKLATLIGLLLFTIVVFYYLDEILSFFLLIVFRGNYSKSYIVTRILRGSLFESKSRNIIYNQAIEEIKSMGFHIYGLFGDRIRLDPYGFSGGHTTNYVHNIALELLLSFGWILGTIIILFIIIRLFDRFFKSKNQDFKIILFFLICLVLMKLMVSGSFLVEGRFAIFMAMLFNRYYKRVQRQEKRT